MQACDQTKCWTTSMTSFSCLNKNRMFHEKILHHTSAVLMRRTVGLCWRKTSPKPYGNILIKIRDFYHRTFHEILTRTLSRLRRASQTKGQLLTITEYFQLLLKQQEYAGSQQTAKEMKTMRTSLTVPPHNPSYNPSLGEQFQMMKVLLQITHGANFQVQRN